MNIYEVIRRPHITEKTSLQKETARTVAFEVHRDATKSEIKKAVEKLFGVKVETVRVAPMRGKLRRQGRTLGRQADGKKAYVVLKEGEKMIEFHEAA